MGDKTSQNTSEEEEETQEEIEEVEEYDLLPTKKKDVSPKEPEESSSGSSKTIIEKSEKIEGKDYCPFCESEEISKDFRRNIYVCRSCGKAWKIIG